MDQSFTGSLASIGTDYADESQINPRWGQALQDQMLAAALLNSGLLEDVDAGVAAVDTGTGVTLREMRRTGTLGEVGGDEQSTLLNSTLFQYSETAPATRAAEAWQATAGTFAATSPRATLATQEIARLRQGLDRIIQETALLSTGDSHILNDSLMTTGITRLNETMGLTGPMRLRTPYGESSVADFGDTLNLADRSPGGRTADLLEGVLSVAGDDVSEMIRINHSGDLQRQRTGGSSTGSVRLDDEDEEVLESSNSELLVGLGGSRSVLSPSTTIQSDRSDGSVAGMLRRLAATNVAALDESLLRSVRRVLQMGAVLAGARLADEEIEALPKVRFNQAEEQQCAICLEAFRAGELLTQLPCAHFFHVDCVGRWFQRSAQCPLCRTQCQVLLGSARGHAQGDALEEQE